MSRVEFAEAMMEPFPAESASLADLVQEMVFHAGVPPSCAGALLATYQHEAFDVEDLKKLARSAVVAMQERHGLGDAVVTKLGMILGTLVNPHVFHDPIAQAPLPDNDDTEGGKPNKGGPTTNVGSLFHAGSLFQIMMTAAAGNKQQVSSPLVPQVPIHCRWKWVLLTRRRCWWVLSRL